MRQTKLAVFCFGSDGQCEDAAGLDKDGFDVLEINAMELAISYKAKKSISSKWSSVWCSRSCRLPCTVYPLEADSVVETRRGAAVHVVRRDPRG